MTIKIGKWNWALFKQKFKVSMAINISSYKQLLGYSQYNTPYTNL
jgi:hypothetical protein